MPPHWDDDHMERMYSIAMGETIVKLPPSIRGSHPLPLPAENQAKSPEEAEKMWLDALVLYLIMHGRSRYIITLGEAAITSPQIRISKVVLMNCNDDLTTDRSISLGSLILAECTSKKIYDSLQ